jgi:multiple sugar transport system ATP-binding protein
MANVTISKVGKRFGAVEVLRDASIDIRDGEFVVLVGPSGCGKSTLLRMLAGLEDISAGDLSIDGRLVNDLHPKDRDIAMVFQNYALYPHMTVAQNMAFSLELKGLPKAERHAKVAAAADILGLSSLLHRHPRQLSGGQRQRVAMGRAIVRDPKVFLFDEPLSNLDAKMRVQVRTEIKQMHQRLRTTTIYVTHDQIEAMTMADRIVVMREGRIEQIGTPLEVYDRPANLFVAGLIGSPGMNLLEGKPVNGGFAIDEACVVHVKAPAGTRRIGLRPEHIGLSSDRLTATILTVESTGSEIQLTVLLGRQALTSVLRDRIEVRAGDIVSIKPDTAHIHFFNDKDNRII